MHNMTCDIRIGVFQFDFVHAVRIRKSWKNLTDTAVVELPRNLALNGVNIRDQIRRGDEVIINMGYDYNHREVFVGYVREVEPGVPVKIHCEDSMWQLKQTNYKLSWRDVSLQELLEAIITPSGFLFTSLADAQLGPVRLLKEPSAAKVLQMLKERYGLVSYFRGRRLFVGFAYSIEPERIELGFQKNIVRENLKYKRRDDIELKIRAISIQPDGNKIEEVIGSQTGESHTLHFYDLDADSLRVEAQEHEKLLRIDGYRGTVTTFGVPYAEHGDIVELTDCDYPERSGRYFIDEVWERFDSFGYRRTLHIGSRVG